MDKKQNPTHHAVINYPLTFSTKLQSSYTGYIHYSFPGKENEPNLTYYGEKSESPAQFVSKDLYIFSKIHDFLDIPPHDGELVISHTPITNTDKPFYICFPLESDTTAANAATMHDILNDEDTANREIDIMNAIKTTSLDGSSSNPAYYYETPYATVVVAQTPIKVSASFVGFNRGKIDDLWEKPREVDIIQLYIKDSLRLSSTPFQYGRGVVKYEPNESATNPLVWFANKPSKTREGYCDGSYCFFDCDYINADFENETPTYMIPAGSDTINLKEKSLNWAVTVCWLLFTFIISILSCHYLFYYIATQIIYKEQAGENKRNIILDKINAVESGIFQLFFIPGFILTSIGTDRFIKCENKKDKEDKKDKKDYDDCIQKATDMIVPGTIILGISIFFVFVMLLYKTLSPNFLGEGFQYTTRIDFYNGYYFMPIWPIIMSIWYIIDIFSK
jgi:hypothetical protein